MFKSFKAILIILFIGLLKPLTASAINRIGFVYQTDTPISKNSFLPLIEYMTRSLRYPADARSAGVQGNLIISFDLTTEGMIANAKVYGTNEFSDEAHGIDKETVSVLNAYKDKKKHLRPGSYLLPVTFVLDQTQPPPAIDKAIIKLPNCLFQILITAVPSRF